MMRLFFFLLICAFSFACDDEAIHERFTGELTEASDRLDDGTAFARHAFRGAQGQRVSLVLESDGFDGYLGLFNSEGEQLASESEQDGETRISWRLPKNDVYTVVVNTESQTFGAYRLRVDTE